MDGLRHPPKWRLTCFSAIESTSGEPGQQRDSNEVNGDVSFEEVRWADYQTPDKQLCASRFAQATTLKNQQFEVSLTLSVLMCHHCAKCVLDEPRLEYGAGPVSGMHHLRDRACRRQWRLAAIVDNMIKNRLFIVDIYEACSYMIKRMTS